MESLARALVERHGSDTLSFFKLRADVARLFTADLRAFLGYAVVGGVLLVGGDPVGAADALGDLVGLAGATAAAQGLRVGVLGASEEGRRCFEEAGMRSLYIGDEAIVDAAAFSLAGGRMRRLRKPVARLRRRGFTTELVTVADLTPAALAELEALAERGRLGRAERSFAWAMEGLGGEHGGPCVVAVARDAQGTARGLLHFVPTYGPRRTLSLSLMRRDRDAPNGLMDLLVVAAIQGAPALGFVEVSLNFAAFARVLRAPRGRAERGAAAAVRLFSRWIQMESLYRFNAKFAPRWEPRYLVYEGRAGFLRTGVAAMRIEGQLPFT